MPDIQPTATYRTPSCIICRQFSLIELPAPIAAALSAGVLVQDLLPDMPRPEREQLVSGTHPACWAAIFGEPDNSAHAVPAGLRVGRRGGRPPRAPPARTPT